SPLTTRIASDVPLARALRTGDTVPFEVALPRVHVFSRGTGARLNRDTGAASAPARSRAAA
nr:sugar ABC transporter ATP-binding protein [Burkholderia sp. Ac-20379]